MLRPGGRLHFVEHGLSPDPGVAAWQHRLNGVQQRVAGGCTMNRPIEALVTGAGFRIERLDTFYEKGTPKMLGHLYEGAAVG